MKKKLRRPSRSSRASLRITLQKKIKSSFQKFKKLVEGKLGRIDWKNAGILAIALLLFVATKGFLGPEAKIIASQIVKFAAYA